MIDALRTYHTMLRSSGSSGYPNMSFFNPQHQQQPFPLAGQVEPLYNPYQRLGPIGPRRSYQQQPQQSLMIGRRYGVKSYSSRPSYNNQNSDLDFLRR